MRRRRRRRRAALRHGISWWDPPERSLSAARSGGSAFQDLRRAARRLDLDSGLAVAVASRETSRNGSGIVDLEGEVGFDLTRVGTDRHRKAGHVAAEAHDRLARKR